MKVIYIGGEYIENGEVRPEELKKYIDQLEIGKRYTVIGEKWEYYKLEEFPDYTLWLKECFVPASDIDETEMVREYNKEKV